jgi:hypothetical protein
MDITRENGGCKQLKKGKHDGPQDIDVTIKDRHQPTEEQREDIEWRFREMIMLNLEVV